MTALLDRLDERAANVAESVGPGEVAGWVCIAVGGPTAVLSFGYVVALLAWGDLLAVGDLL